MKLENQKFIDLFAGIGGFHQALSHYGAQCVFASEIDKHASGTYLENYGIRPHGDITKIDEKDIPYHNILCAGFPCQAFSISGKQKGFDDIRGNLFWEILRIVRYHLPGIVVLENVKNLARHDSGHTLEIILGNLEDLGYNCKHQVINATDYQLPQNRERIYIVCFREDMSNEDFEFPFPKKNANALNDILQEEVGAEYFIQRDDVLFTKECPSENASTKQVKPLNRTLQIGKVGKGRQGERIYSPLGHAITLSAHGGGIGAKTGLYKINGRIRKLTPRECARLQGFPETFKIISSNSQAYTQFGNSVAINVLKEIFNSIEKMSQDKPYPNKKQVLGSTTAKGGFSNEVDIENKFKNFDKDKDVQSWLTVMGYDYTKIADLKAFTIPPRISLTKAMELGATPEKVKETLKFKKSDLQLHLKIQIDNILYVENISLKKANISAGFNQIDKRPVSTYQQMWGFNDSIANTLKRFTGEIPPPKNKTNLRDNRRLYLDEIEPILVEELLQFIMFNKVQIFNDLLRGRGALAADWFLVTRKNKSTNHIDYIIKDINFVSNFFSQGEITVSKRGGLILGRITVQRKGGTPDPKSLQFKINPLHLFENKS